MRGELRTLIKLAIPISVAEVGITTLGLVEVAVLGHTTASALGGASIGRSLSFVAGAIGWGIAAAVEPLASQAVGAKDYTTGWRAFVATLRAAVLVGIVCAIGEVGAALMLPWFGIADAIVQPARMFVFAQAPSLMFVTFYLAGKGFLQAYGQTRHALLAAVFANVVNLVLSYVLVLKLGLGAFGAGLTNSIANVVLAAGVLVPAWRLRPENPGEERLVRKVLSLGFPIGLQFLAEVGAFSLVAVLAGRLGEVAIGAHQIAIGLASTTFMAVLGVSGATSVRVGVAVGEGRSARLPGFLGIGTGAALMTISGLTFWTFPSLFASAFTTHAPTIALAIRLLGIAALFQIFDGIQGVAAGALRGAGDVRFPFLANVGGHWLIGFPLALILGFGLDLGAVGLWWGLLTGLGMVAALLTWRFHRISRGLIART